MAPVAIRCFHHYDIGQCRDRFAKQRPPRITKITGEQYPAALFTLLQFQQDTGRTQNMAGIQKRSAHARRQFQRLSINRHTPESVQAVQGIRRSVKGSRNGRINTPLLVLAGRVTRVLFLQMGGIQHDQSGQFPRSGRCDDFAGKSPFCQQRQTTAVVQVRVREQHKVDALRIKSERVGIVLAQFMPALIHPAIDQDPPACALHQMAGTGNIAVCAVKG